MRWEEGREGREKERKSEGRTKDEYVWRMRIQAGGKGRKIRMAGREERAKRGIKGEWRRYNE